METKNAAEVPLYKEPLLWAAVLFYGAAPLLWGLDYYVVGAFTLGHPVNEWLYAHLASCHGYWPWEFNFYALMGEEC